jgi:hypothetical protein
LTLYSYSKDADIGTDNLANELTDLAGFNNINAIVGDNGVSDVLEKYVSTCNDDKEEEKEEDKQSDESSDDSSGSSDSGGSSEGSSSSDNPSSFSTELNSEDNIYSNNNNNDFTKVMEHKSSKIFMTFSEYK